jgi:general stress protein 26
MKRADFVYLSTVDDEDYPQIRGMGNLWNEAQFPRLVSFFDLHHNDFLVYISTNRSSAKIRQIHSNPKGGLYYSDFEGVHGLLLSGDLEIVENPEVRAFLWQEDWEQFYPGGVAGDEYEILRVQPHRAKGWYQNGKFEFNI